MTAWAGFFVVIHLKIYNTNDAIGKWYMMPATSLSRKNTCVSHGTLFGHRNRERPTPLASHWAPRSPEFVVGCNDPLAARVIRGQVCAKTASPAAIAEARQTLLNKSSGVRGLNKVNTLVFRMISWSCSKRQVRL